MREALPPCPASPNCVSSDADPDDATHYVAPFRLKGPADAAWTALREEVERLGRTEIVTDEPGHLAAVQASRLLRFKDDLELRLRRSDGEIAVRSASRVGYSDLGVNRKRVETLRERLRARGVLE